jgi:hypothetical protein
MDLRTELLKFLDYYENVHNDGDWSFDNVVDKYIQNQHDGKPIVNRSKCNYHAVFTFCGDNGITYCSNCGDPV